MNSVNSLSPSSTYPITPCFSSPKWFHHHHLNLKNHHHETLTICCSIRRHQRRRRQPEKTSKAKHFSLPSDSKLQMVIDLEHLTDKTSFSLKRLLRSSELKFNQFVDLGNQAHEAFEDLRTLITFASDRRVIFSCERSTVHFMGNLIVFGLVIVVAFRALVKIGFGFLNIFRFQKNYDDGLIRRRDRSLGGREVVVGKRKEIRKETRGSVNPLSFAGETLEGVSNAVLKNWARRMEEKLPSWWPVSLPPPVVTVNKQEYQQNADRLIRAIMEYRLSGKDISMNDIILLRRICRTSGVRVFIDPTNSRDSLYRAAIDFALNICSSIASQSSFVQIDGEDARKFIAGLAYNIRLENIRATRMVAAAVAAHTRSWLLQAWALEMQGKHSEAVVELAKLCIIHRIFPPEEDSPEMEMVARGLEKHLKVEQREYLLNMVRGVCREESSRSVAEALGLVISTERVGHQQENKHS